MAKYDDASWHYNGDFPLELPRENGATHIGYYITWCIENDFISDLQMEESEEDIIGVLNRKITGRDFLIRHCDEKFTDEDLNEQGNSFTRDYYADDSEFIKQTSSYLGDFAKAVHVYCQAFNMKYKSEYHLEESWEFYNAFQEILSMRYAQWKTFKNIE